MMTHTLCLRSAPLLAVLGLLLAPLGARATTTSSSFGATLTVTVTNPNDSGNGSLRAAIAQANADGASGAYDTITFANGVADITLTSGELSITTPMTISGPGVTVSGNNNSRVFEVGGGTSSQPVTLSGLTITDGNTSGNGGGVLVDAGAVADLTGCTLTGNSAPGSGGLSSFGGGVYNDGTVTLTACALTGNSANNASSGGFGGGVYNEGTATLTGCTLTGNSAGGATAGGGLANFGGTTTLDDDILYGDTGYLSNEAYLGGGTVTAAYCDIGEQIGGGDGVTDNGHNFDADPLFVSPPNDLRLQPGSTCVGAGDPALAGTQDITGATRPDPPSVGAYEGVAAATATSLALTTGSSPSVYGQTLTFTATVTDQIADGPSPPMGTVTFTYTPQGGGSAIVDGARPLSGSGQATDSPALPVGTYSVTASYAPAAHNFLPSATATPVTQTVNAAPVTGVSATWGSRTAALTAGGSLLPAGRSVDVPWLGVSSFGLTLSAPEALSAADVTVTGVRVASYGPVTVSGSGTAYTVTLSRPVSAADRVTLTVGNAGIASFSGVLPVLPGDVSGDGAVNASDLVLTRNALRTTSVYADINGDGAVNITDYTLVRQRIGTRLP